MSRIATGSQVASLPTHAAAIGTPGYAADASTTPSADPTELDACWVNHTQEARVRVIEDAGETPSRTDFDQFKNVVAGVHGIKAHATTLTNVSTPKTRTVVGSTSSTASAAKALVGASSGGVASGEESMCLGTQGTSTATARNAAVIASNAGLAGAAQAVVLGCDSATASGAQSVCLGGTAQNATAARTAVVGGTSGAASAADAGTFAGDNPTASGLKAVAAGGHDLTASGENAAAIGGDTNVAAAAESFCGGGNSHDIQSGSTRAAVVGGNNHTINAARAIALGGDTHSLTGADSAALGGSNNIAQAAKSFVIGGTGNDVAAAQCGVLASDTCQIMNTDSKTNMLLLGSKYAELHNDGDPSGGGIDGFCVAGGYSGSDPGATVVNTNIEWLLSSKHGTLALDNTTLISGADYAELFENAVDGVIPPGSLVARAGRKVKIAEPGDRVLGVVSAAPSVVGNSADLGWSGRKLRDEWGALVYEDVEMCRFEVTEIQPVEHCRFKLVETGPKGGKVVKYRYRGRVAACPVEIPAAAERYFVDRPVVVYRYHGPAATCPVEIPADAERWVSRDPVRNPDFDPSRPYVARRHRPDQWTAVALLGQVRVRIGKGVEEGDFLTPGADGCALGSSAGPSGRPVEVMEITQPYDPAKGYGIALCLVG